MRSGRTVVVGLSLLALSEAGPMMRPAHAFDLDAHAFLSRQSTGGGVNGVNFDELLRRQLGFMAGINEKFAGKTAREWIIEGSRLEDSPFPRVLAHFHDPLQPFDTVDQAGLRFLGIQFESAAVWAQDTNQGRLPYLGGKHSWFDAREAFFKALTASNDGDRRNAVAETFRSLGQVLHLVQDQASPAHTRNDAHPPVIDPDGFHTWADRPAGLTAILESPPEQPAPSLLDPDPTVRGNQLAPLRIARLIDTGRLSRTNVPEAGNDIGIAEFSSANFLSDGRIAGTVFTRPLPSRSSTDLQELTDPKTQEKRLYLVKAREGATGYRLAAVSVFGNFLAASLDDAVYADYGRVLFPRVIGLGSALINHFFRGRIEIAAPDRFVYALAPFTVDNREFFTTLRFKVRKAAPSNEPAGAGTIVAVAQYRLPLGDSNLFENPMADLSPTRLTSVSAPQNITLTDSFQELVFDFRSQPIPTNAADLVLNVVYRGQLGLEPNAVFFGGKDIPEPDPVYIINATDYDCFGGQPILVAGLGSGAARDLDHDGFFPDVFGPALEQGILVKIQQANTRQSPTPSFFDFRIPLMTGGQYSRFVMLQDQFSYDVGVLTDVLLDTSNGDIRTRFLRFFRLTAITNTLSVDFDGSVRHQISFFPLQYRGLNFLHGVATVNFNGQSCFLQTFTLPPNVTGVPGTLPPPESGGP